MLKKIFLTVAMTVLFFSTGIFSTANAQTLERIGVADIEVRLSERLMNVESERVYKTFPAAAQILVDELTKGLLDRADVIDLLAETQEERLNETLNEMIARGNPIELRTLDCDYIVHGYLMNVSRSNGDNVLTKNDTITVELGVRVLDVKNDRCAFATVGRGVSKAKQFRVGPLIRFGHAEFYEGQLNGALKEAAHQIAREIIENF